jgi:hypothetical protein
VLRVVLGALILLATMTAIHRDHIGVHETNLFWLVNDLALPWWARWPIWLVMQLGVIGAVPLVAVLALATRRLWLAAYAVLAGGTIYLVAWALAGLVCLARIYVGSHRPFDVLGGAALSWAAGALVLLVFGAPSGQPSLARVRKALAAYGCDPADLEPLPGQDRRSARYLVSSHSRPDLFVKVVSRERRDSDLLYRAWRWLRHRGRPPGRLGDAVAQVEHEASMGLLAAAAGVRTRRSCWCGRSATARPARPAARGRPRPDRPWRQTAG